MTIILSGGGSGGHITPLLAVAAELKKTHPAIRLIYIGQRGDKLADIPARDPNIDAVYFVSAGKFRRYHGDGLKQLLDVKTLAKNSRDFFRLLRGIWQSWRLLGRLKPDCIFIRGGFVGVPVGLSAAAHHIPYVTHDSDAVASLANRLIARWATIHAVALPKNMYNYPAAKTVSIGVPISHEFQKVTSELQKQYRRHLGIKSKRVICVTGGGLGAHRLNEIVLNIAPKLLTAYPDLTILHLCGRDHEHTLNTGYDTRIEPARRSQVIVKGFVTDLFRYSGAADVVIARAGATNLAEFATQGKACVLVPNPHLTGGHQLKNAETLVAAHAVEVITETDLKKQGSGLLEHAISKLLDSESDRRALGHQLTAFAHPKAAHELANLLLHTAGQQ